MIVEKISDNKNLHTPKVIHNYIKPFAICVPFNKAAAFMICIKSIYWH